MVYHWKAWVRFPIHILWPYLKAMSEIFSVKEKPDLEIWVWDRSWSLQMKMVPFDTPSRLFIG